MVSVKQNPRVLAGHNLKLIGFGRDRNGNSVVKVKGGSVGLSVQTNGNLPETHRLRTIPIKKLTDDQLDKIFDEVGAYIAQHGTARQRKVVMRNPKTGEIKNPSVTRKQLEALIDFGSFIRTRKGNITSDDAEYWASKLDKLDISYSVQNKTADLAKYGDQDKSIRTLLTQAEISFKNPSTTTKTYHVTVFDKGSRIIADMFIKAKDADEARLVAKKKVKGAVVTSTQIYVNEMKNPDQKPDVYYSIWSKSTGFIWASFNNKAAAVAYLNKYKMDKRKFKIITRLVKSNPKTGEIENPSLLSKEAVKLRRKIRSLFRAGMPDDQLTEREKEIVRKHSKHFENDHGYIKVKSARRNPKSNEYCVVYRTGGTHNFKWHRTAAMSKAKALEAKEDIERGGRVAHIEKYARSMAIGLPETYGKRKNDTKGDFVKWQKLRLNELSEMFQGEASGTRKRVLEPDTAPSNKYRLGHLVLMKVRPNGSRKVVNIEFDGDAFLAGDLRNNLWAVGKDARVENPQALGIKTVKNGMVLVGDLIQIDYVTAKKHIENGQLVRFWHPLGEINKEYPKLYLDADKFPVIVGGGYDVWDVGIVN